MFPSPVGRARNRPVLRGLGLDEELFEAGIELESKVARVAEPYQSPKLQLAKALLCTAQLSRARTAMLELLDLSIELERVRSTAGCVLQLTEIEVRAGNLAQAEAYAAEFVNLDRQLRGDLGDEWYPSGVVAMHLGRRRRRTTHPDRGRRVLPGDLVDDLARSPSLGARSPRARDRQSRRGPRDRSDQLPQMLRADGPRRVVGAPVPPGPDRDARRPRRDRRGGRADGRARGVRPPARSTVGPRDRRTLERPSSPRRAGETDAALEAARARARASTSASTGRSSAAGRCSSSVGFSVASGAAVTPPRRSPRRSRSSLASAIRSGSRAPRRRSGGSAAGAVRATS